MYSESNQIIIMTKIQDEGFKMDHSSKTHLTFNITVVKRLLHGGRISSVRSILTRMKVADISSLLLSCSEQEMELLVTELISLDKASEVILGMPENKIKSLLNDLNHYKIMDMMKCAPVDNSSYLLSLMDKEAQQEVLQKLPPFLKSSLIQRLSYKENSIGLKMDTQVFCLPAGTRVEHCFEKIRKLNVEDKTKIYYIYCVDPSHPNLDSTSITSYGKLTGAASLRQLAMADPEQTLDEICQRDLIFVNAEDSTSIAAELIRKYDFIALPVVNSDNHLIGIISIDTIVDILQELGEQKAYARSGLKKDDRIFTPALESIRKRTPWMILNLGLAFGASSVVSLFEDTMNHLIILASLKNIVAGVSGNAAIQSLTVVTRGLAAGDFSFISKQRALLKELVVGASLGLLTGLSAAVLTYLWKGNLMVSCVIFVSMTLTSLLAAVVGAFTPLLIEKMGRDPAVGSGVLSTTLTDIISFLSFLGISQLALAYFS